MSHLVLYDGVCGLCDRFVQFLLTRDRRDQLRFAALQGAIGAETFARFGRTSTALSTVVVVVDHGLPSEHLLERSDAALFTIGSLGSVYGAAPALRVVPRFMRDGVYDLVARTRYRIFGRFDSCPVPSPATRAKFLDFPAARPRSGAP